MVAQNDYSLLIQIDETKLEKQLEKVQEKFQKIFEPSSQLMSILNSAQGAKANITGETSGTDTKPMKVEETNSAMEMKKRLGVDRIKEMQKGFGAVGKQLLPLVGIGLGIGSLVTLITSSSEILKGTFGLIKTSIELIFKPIGDFIGLLLRPFVLLFISQVVVPWITTLYPLVKDAATNFNSWFGVQQTEEGAAGSIGSIERGRQALLAMLFGDDYALWQLDAESQQAHDSGFTDNEMFKVFDPLAQWLFGLLNSIPPQMAFGEEEQTMTTERDNAIAYWFQKIQEQLKMSVNPDSELGAQVMAAAEWYADNVGVTDTLLNIEGINREIVNGINITSEQYSESTQDIIDNLENARESEDANFEDLASFWGEKTEEQMQSMNESTESIEGVRMVTEQINEKAALLTRLEELGKDSNAYQKLSVESLQLLVNMYTAIADGTVKGHDSTARDDMEFRGEDVDTGDSNQIDFNRKNNADTQFGGGGVGPSIHDNRSFRQMDDKGNVIGYYLNRYNPTEALARGSLSDFKEALEFYQTTDQDIYDKKRKITFVKWAINRKDYEKFRREGGEPNSGYTSPFNMSTGAQVRQFAMGGMINEPIFGVGRSGQTYMMGEAGPEKITPMNNNTTTDNNVVINMNIQVTKEVDVEKLVRMVSQRFQEEFRRLM